ncbi:MAG: RnfABCDGE type electron transport complex subunit D [Leptolyngbyaceae bacterium]|nr:RnfABCDGE type electron transport complex subunit D [Leptolyngbyaceae bacterium]
MQNRIQQLTLEVVANTTVTEQHLEPDTPVEAAFSKANGFFQPLSWRSLTIWQDARSYQILFLGCFLVVGISTRDWSLRPEVIGAAIATCLTTQWLAVSWQNKISPLHFLFLSDFQTSDSDSSLGKPPIKWSLPSALITALGLSLLLRVDHVTTMMLASTLAILSKFVLKIRGKHVFNPANFGILAVVLLTHDAWISPGQWGEDGWYALMFAGAGALVLQRVGRWDTTAAFLGSYALLEAVRNLWLGWTWDVFLHRLMSGSLLLFALFLITDPRSIPNARTGRLIWAVAIAILTFILRNHFFITTAGFWALFALSPLSVLLDLVWSAPRFSWLQPSPPLPIAETAATPNTAIPAPYFQA